MRFKDSGYIYIPQKMLFPPSLIKKFMKTVIKEFNDLKYLKNILSDLGEANKVPFLCN